MVNYNQKRKGANTMKAFVALVTIIVIIIAIIWYVVGVCLNIKYLADTKNGKKKV